MGNHRAQKVKFCRKQHIVLWLNNVKQYLFTHKFFDTLRSVNASFTWDLTNRSVRLRIVFLTEHKVFDILNVLVDTHRTRFTAAWLPTIFQIFFNRVSILPNFQPLSENFAISSFWHFPTVRQLHYISDVGNKTIFRRRIDWLLSMPKSNVIGQCRKCSHMFFFYETVYIAPCGRNFGCAAWRQVGSVSSEIPFRNN